MLKSGFGGKFAFINLLINCISHEMVANVDFNFLNLLEVIDIVSNILGNFKAKYCRAEGTSQV